MEVPGAAPPEGVVTPISVSGEKVTGVVTPGIVAVILKLPFWLRLTVYRALACCSSVTFIPLVWRLPLTTDTVAPGTAVDVGVAIAVCNTKGAPGFNPGDAVTNPGAAVTKGAPGVDPGVVDATAVPVVPVPGPVVGMVA